MTPILGGCRDPFTRRPLPWFHDSFGDWARAPAKAVDGDDLLRFAEKTLTQTINLRRDRVSTNLTGRCNDFFERSDGVWKCSVLLAPLSRLPMALSLPCE